MNLVTRPPEWHRAATRADVKAAGGLQVRLGGRAIALLWWRDRVFAMQDHCPHRGSPLHTGILSPDGFLSCLDHGWEYSLETGCGRAGYEGCADTFEVDDRAGDIWVKVTFRPAPDFTDGWPD